MSNPDLKKLNEKQNDVNELSNSRSSRRIRFYTGNWPNKWEENYTGKRNRSIKGNFNSKKRKRNLWIRRSVYSMAGILIIYLLIYSKLN